MLHKLINFSDFQETATKQGIAAMPTFQFFKANVKVDELKGADAKVLEEKIKKWIGDDNTEDSGVKGYVSKIMLNIIYDNANNFQLSGYLR